MVQSVGVACVHQWNGNVECCGLFFPARWQCSPDRIIHSEHCARHWGTKMNGTPHCSQRANNLWEGKNVQLSVIV